MTSVTVTKVANGYMVSREEDGHEVIRVALDAQGLVDAINGFDEPQIVTLATGLGTRGWC